MNVRRNLISVSLMLTVRIQMVATPASALLDSLEMALSAADVREHNTTECSFQEVASVLCSNFYSQLLNGCAFHVPNLCSHSRLHRGV